MSSKSAPLANPRHPLQRYESPSKGFSGALHVRCLTQGFIGIISNTGLGCWSDKFLPRVQVVRKHKNKYFDAYRLTTITVWSTILTSSMILSAGTSNSSPFSAFPSQPPVSSSVLELTFSIHPPSLSQRTTSPSSPHPSRSSSASFTGVSVPSTQDSLSHLIYHFHH
jgi:hypothetical protein